MYGGRARWMWPTLAIGFLTRIRSAMRMLAARLWGMTEPGEVPVTHDHFPDSVAVDIDAPADGPLAGAFMKAAWAQAHRETLVGLMREFVNAPPPMMTMKKTFDETRGLWTISVDQVYPLPGRWSLFLGDFLTNARAALDYAAWEMVRLGTPSGPVQEHLVTFTIEEKETGAKKSFESSVARQMPGIRAEHLDVVRSFQPYQAGENAAQHPFAILKRLSNIDKHRKLHLTVPYVNSAVEMRVESSDFAVSRHEEGNDLAQCVHGGFFPGAELMRVFGSVAGPEPSVTGAISGSSVLVIREGNMFYQVEDVVSSIVDRIASLLVALEPLMTEAV